MIFRNTETDFSFDTGDMVFFWLSEVALTQTIDLQLKLIDFFFFFFFLTYVGNCYNKVTWLLKVI